MTPPGSNSIVDLSHWNWIAPGPDPFEAAAKSGILAVWHKCSQGRAVDSTYRTRKQEVLTLSGTSLRLLWGAYHFLEPVDAGAQANTFAQWSNLRPGDLAALDVEYYAGKAPNLDAAEEFFGVMSTRSGDYFDYSKGLVLYLGEGYDLSKYPLLSAAPRWIPKYGPEPETKHALWQYTDGKQGPWAPCPVPGIGSCNRSTFNGTDEELVKWWTGGAI